MDLKDRITAVAELVQEFRLAQVRYTEGDVSVAFKKHVPTPSPDMMGGTVVAAPEYIPDTSVAVVAVEAPKGMPVASPMAGIFYPSPSPSAPPFAKEGDTVTAGQVIGLIEAMKVFNEIPAPVSGTVLSIVATSGQLVQPGETLLLIG